MKTITAVRLSSVADRAAFHGGEAKSIYSCGASRAAPQTTPGATKVHLSILLSPGTSKNTHLCFLGACERARLAPARARWESVYADIYGSKSLIDFSV